jgi:hypothetical protein
LTEIGVVRASVAGEPHGYSARCPTPALSVRQEHTGDYDRNHELKDAETELGHRRQQPSAKRRDLRSNLAKGSGNIDGG